MEQRLKKNWLIKGLEESAKEVAKWPKWKRDSITVEEPLIDKD